MKNMNQIFTALIILLTSTFAQAEFQNVLATGFKCTLDTKIDEEYFKVELSAHRRGCEAMNDYCMKPYVLLKATSLKHDEAGNFKSFVKNLGYLETSVKYTEEYKSIRFSAEKNSKVTNLMDVGFDLLASGSSTLGEFKLESFDGIAKSFEGSVFTDTKLLSCMVDSRLLLVEELEESPLEYIRQFAVMYITGHSKDFLAFQKILKNESLLSTSDAKITSMLKMIFRYSMKFANGPNLEYGLYDNFFENFVLRAIRISEIISIEDKRDYYDIFAGNGMVENVISAIHRENDHSDFDFKKYCELALMQSGEENYYCKRYTGQ